MMISELVAQDKDISIVELAGKLEQFVRRAAEDGELLVLTADGKGVPGSCFARSMYPITGTPSKLSE